jgi:hypothetical protein
LSINQRDKLEREHQVQQKRQIYANAPRVLVSLSESTEDIAFAFDHIKRRYKGKLPTDPLLNALRDRDNVPDTDYLSFAASETKFNEVTRTAIATLLGCNWWNGSGSFRRLL